MTNRRSGGWTCRGCKTKYPTRHTKTCKVCGRAQPKKRVPSHRKELDSMTYDEVVALNGGDFCWICKFLHDEFGINTKHWRPRRPTEKRLHRDHDHTTGRVRGLLCFQHNKRLIGNRTLPVFEAAAAYLRRSA
jgi:hypothetical protein